MSLHCLTHYHPPLHFNISLHFPLINQRATTELHVNQSALASACYKKQTGRVMSFKILLTFERLLKRCLMTRLNMTMHETHIPMPFLRNLESTASMAMYPRLNIFLCISNLHTMAPTQFFSTIACKTTES